MVDIHLSMLKLQIHNNALSVPDFSKMNLEAMEMVKNMMIVYSIVSNKMITDWTRLVARCSVFLLYC